jgi:oxalate decarboxylase/phosphoglucose isomerase-like protein (cupin superfamily)
MKHYNIYNNQEPKLGQFTDDRGSITDIFHLVDMNSGCLITNTPGAIRANHYHKLTTQYTYILTGSIDYYSKPVDSEEPANVITAGPGDFIISEPNEIHAWRTGAEGCTLIAFAQGPRGGEDYESDTIRVESIIPNV